MPITCCICTDNVMTVVSDGAHSTAGDSQHPCTIPCGHVFHVGCLRHWLKRPYPIVESTCPECRARCTASEIIKLYMIDESPALSTATTPSDLVNSLTSRNLIKDWHTARWESLQHNRLIVRLTEEVSKLEYKLEQSETAGLSKFGRLERAVADAKAEHEASERRWSSEKQSLQDRLRATAEKLRKYKDAAAAAAAAASRPVQRCNNNRCTGTVPGRIYCPLHPKCNNRCHIGIRGMSLLRTFENGGEYCTACVPYKCFICRRRLAGSDSVKFEGKIVHESCVSCMRCSHPLNCTAKELWQPENNYHPQCLVCVACDRIVSKYMVASCNGPEVWCTCCASDSD